MSEKMYVANLGFFLKSNTGITKDEIESELLRLILQNKLETHYDRIQGGSLMSIEQEPNEESVALFQFYANIVESIYRNNSNRELNRFISVGSSDIMMSNEPDKGRVTIYMQWRLLQNTTMFGELKF
jgi:hypothetical protein